MLTILRLSFAFTLALTSVACTAATGSEDDEELVSADESIDIAGQITGSVTTGSTLRTTDPLNLRSGAGTSYAVLLVMPAGAEVRVASGTPTNGFYQVTYGTRTGWASGSYLASVARQLQATEDVYLRSGAATTYDALDLVPDGATVTLLSATTRNGFYNISYNGRTGWSHADYYVASSGGTGTGTGSASCSSSITALFCKVPYISQINNTGTADDWNKNSNCGPATMAMIGRAFGYRTDLSEGTLINHLANAVGVGPDGSGADKIASMARTMGRQSSIKYGADAVWVKGQLSSGRLVAINGNRVVTLAYDGNSSTNGTGTQGHWIVGAGISPNGNILIKDPSVSACRELTPAQLNEFIIKNYNGNTAVAVW